MLNTPALAPNLLQLKLSKLTSLQNVLSIDEGELAHSNKKELFELLVQGAEYWKSG